MKYILLAAVAVIGASQVFGEIVPPTINKCDDDIINWVNVIWQATSKPSHILHKRSKDKVGLAASSLDYTAAGECSTAVFSGTSATWTLSNIKGEKTFVKEDFTEDTATPGIVTSDGGNIKRYFVFSKDGVNAFYICSVNGPKGNPQGAVSAKLKPLSTATFDLVDYGAALLQYVGIGVNETDIKNCFPKK